MSFENGYNIENYISETIEKYKMDNKIFDKCIKLLNIFMLRSDWPYCFPEYDKITEKILNSNSEFVTHYFQQFSSQAEYGHELLKEWDKILPEGFKDECEIYTNILIPIINQYYDYINNPLGIDKITQIDNSNNRHLIRIKRVDGCVIDLRLSKYDIHNLSAALLDMAEEG